MPMNDYKIYLDQSKPLENKRFLALSAVWVRLFGTKLVKISKLIKYAREDRPMAEALSGVIPDVLSPGHGLSHFLRRFVGSCVEVNGGVYCLSRIDGYWYFKETNRALVKEIISDHENQSSHEELLDNPRLIILQAWLENFADRFVKAEAILNAADRDPKLAAAVKKVLPVNSVKSMGHYLSFHAKERVTMDGVDYAMDIKVSDSNANRYALVICPPGATFDVFGHMTVPDQTPTPAEDAGEDLPISQKEQQQQLIDGSPIVNSWLSHIGLYRPARMAEFIEAIYQDTTALEAAHELFGLVTPQSVKSYLIDASFDPYTITAVDVNSWIIRTSEDTE